MREEKFPAKEFHKQAEKELQAEEAQLKSTHRFFTWFRFISFALILPFIWASTREIFLAEYLAFACGVLFLWGVKRSITIQKKLKRCRYALEIHQHELSCLDHTFTHQPHGLEFLDATHPFALDLDIYGPESLFNQICRCATPEGTRKLAIWLNEPYAEIEEVKQRQRIIQELAAKPHLSVAWRVEAKLNQKNQIEYPESLRNYLVALPFFKHVSLIQVMLIALPLCVWMALGLGIFSIISMKFFWTLAVLQLIITGRFLKKINAYQAKLSPVLGKISLVNALLNVYVGENFNQKQLQEIQLRAQQGIKSMQQFYSLLNTFDLRNNMVMGLLLNGLFMLDLQCIFRLEKWKHRSVEKFENILSDIHLLDVYLSLAMWAYHRPEFVFPEWVSHGQTLKAEHLKHPLMDARKAVGNHLHLETGKQLMLLTGANMTGKSTWLRTVGLTTVCSYLGLPVSASSMQLSPLRVFTSMRINDSLDSGVSYFKAELNRLKALVDAISPDDFNWLVIIDEPLRGTNSGDKQAGTVGILNKCIRPNVTGILATHDTSLCRLEEETKGYIKNAHFDSSIENQQLTFDYTLKSGCSLSNNATILLQIAGIVD